MLFKNVTNLTPLIQVFDMPTSLKFYCDVLGFVIDHSSSPPPDCDWCMLRLGGAVLMLNTRFERDKRPPQPTPTTGHEDVGLYIMCDNVDEAYIQLRDKWRSVEAPKTAPYGMRQMYIADPDGYFVCFQHPVK